MFLQKIKNRESGVLIYSITPPKLSTSLEKVAESAQKNIERIQKLPIDALIVYDVQDESSRTAEVRPFPFQPAMDPVDFSTQYLAELKLPKIIYRPAGKYTKEEITEWFNSLQQNEFHPVLVGIPSPDYVPRISLPEAYAIWSNYKETSVLGAITIPERHVLLNDEDQRILDKVKSGVSYFVSQCVLNEEYSINMLKALKSACDKTGEQVPTIIFTLSTCGSLKTLHFIEWLGIHVADAHKARLQNAANILHESVLICEEIAQSLSEYCVQNNIPFGFNIESVSTRKEEIEASLLLLDKTAAILKAKSLVDQD
ncbi:MAG: 5,10-methylenetetrahydrofolate reductase [Flavobacteriales bacterium]